MKFVEIPPMPPEYMEMRVEHQRIMGRWVLDEATEEEKDRARDLEVQMEAMKADLDAQIKALLG